MLISTSNDRVHFFNNMNTRSTRSKARKSEDVDKTVDYHSSPPAKRAKTKRIAKAIKTSNEPSSIKELPAATDTIEHDTVVEPNGSEKSQDQQSNPPTTLIIHKETGDIFSAPPNTLLIHACNCEGSWGAGIALAFRKSYPSAFMKYAEHCTSLGHDLLGKAFLIPPAPDVEETKRHFVGCLFTSRSKGKKADSPAKILQATSPAMRDLMVQVKEWNARNSLEQKVAEVRMCKINSGLFRVPWEKTRAALETIEVGELDIKTVKVVSLE